MKNSTFCESKILHCMETNVMQFCVKVKPFCLKTLIKQHHLTMKPLCLETFIETVLSGNKTLVPEDLDINLSSSEDEVIPSNDNDSSDDEIKSSNKSDRSKRQF